ncbi:anthranilate synthase family protein [Streptomyces sp. JB150]|uniref:anthranilate synthase family protein n=1 Tax=Streptomyces sp. JB150 TaxID=2714844 RepID=UPI00140E5BC0|nr:anthranilate synthase family protein [Streptomyces sp. JB150]QIJ60701.1 phenazine-specific anthranilate synthase component I [Streptomyces sp. JB150]
MSARRPDAGPRRGGAPDALARVLDGSAPAFALLHRPQSAPGTVEVLLGSAAPYARLGDLPLPQDPEGAGGGPGEVLVVVPYRQLAERGHAVRDDGEALIGMPVAERQELPVAEALRRLPDEPVKSDQRDFDPPDREYAQAVRRVVAEEIGRGAGANFVVRRTFTSRLPDFTRAGALSFFHRLLRRENGAYWTFLVHTPGRWLIGATPERHISVEDGTAVMNPVSGTYCHPVGGPTLDGVLSFLADRKETDELAMVVDEELKTMARICPDGGQLLGPYLKEMARLSHTEYLIRGRCDLDVREVLRETLFAPTVTGSPVESAAEVIVRHESAGRGYYSGVLALIGREPSGRHSLDSAILIRTADIRGGSGATPEEARLSIGVGATLVRHSDPDTEARETRAKAAGLLAALGGGAPGRFAGHPDVRAALAARNDALAGFWLAEPERRGTPARPGRAAPRILLVDGEDTFTAMLGHQLGALGAEVTIRRWDELGEPDGGRAQSAGQPGGGRPGPGLDAWGLDGWDLVVPGPGPGDPRRLTDPKIARLRALLDRLVAHDRPFLAVCLSHQLLSIRLGLDLVRRDVPNQGTRREISLFGRREHVGFYNTFEARCERDLLHHPRLGPVRVARDPASGEVHALQGARFASLQFHPESVLTRDGPRVLTSVLAGLLPP